MKKIVFIIMVVLSSTPFFSQSKNEKNLMEDSLWKSLYQFCITTEKYLNKDFVTQKDVNNYLNYIQTHMGDSVQTTDFFVPFMANKNEAMIYLTEQIKDMVGSKCVYRFVSWDGWDGSTPFTGFRFDICHNGYKDQFLVIVNTTNQIRSIFSVNSKI